MIRQISHIEYIDIAAVIIQVLASENNFTMETRGKKGDNGVRVGFSQSEKVDLSMHSQGIVDNDQDGSQKFFSFNQSFTNIEHNNKLIQERTNSLHKIKNLEDEIKSYKARSDLWEKTKIQIFALNQYLKLSAISLGCSDSAIMREFFDTVGKLVQQKEAKDKEEKAQLAEAARQNAELFQKLVETKKQRYQLEQQLVNIRHQNSKLSDMNTTLRQKSRAQSTERSSKIKEFHEETILTIHQKELELTQLQDRNQQLLHNIKQLEAQVGILHQQLDKRQDQLLEKIQSESVLIKRCEQVKKELDKTRQEKAQLEHCKQEQKQTEEEIAEIKDYLKNIVQENITIRTELARRADIITELRKIIQDARSLNQQCIAQQAHIAEQQKNRQKIKITELLKAEETLKKHIKVNSRFAINSPKSYRHRQSSQSKSSLGLLPSSEELLI